MSYPIDNSRHSPNTSSREGAAIRMLVLHATVGSYDSARNWLCNPQPLHPNDRVSTHYLIRKDGHIAQLVPDSLAAWHAGESAWMGMDSEQIQHCSIGIELENADDGRDPYPPSQIGAAHWLCQSLISRYNIERPDVVRHLDIAPGRKFDPAPPAFPWPLFADSLYLDAPPTPVPPPPATNPLRHYRVLPAVTGGATIRSGPSKAAAVLGRLHAGDSWVGEEVVGQLVTIAGFGSSNIWIRDTTMRCVWSGLLQQVRGK